MSFSESFPISYRTVEDQNIHLTRLAGPAFFQIAINIKIPKTEAAKAFFKQPDLLCSKIDGPDAETLTGFLWYDIVHAAGA